MEQRQAQGEQGLLSKQVTAELAAIGKQRFQDFVSAQDELQGHHVFCIGALGEPGQATQVAV